MEAPTHQTVPLVAERGGHAMIAERSVPEEVAVALSFNGTAYAVMMATPADLVDFAVGFALSEGIATSAGQLTDIALVALESGYDVQVTLDDEAAGVLEARRRRIAGPVGCGLCGIDSIAEAMRPAPHVHAGLSMSAEEIVASVRLLSENQPLNRETRAVHAAGFFLPGRGLVAVREDVGRHNALDKLAGALAREGVAGGSGAVVITSRVSLEMVQKTAAIGASILIAVSAPTALAIRVAEAAGITLVALVRGEDFDVYTHTNRIVSGGESRHVA